MKGMLYFCIWSDVFYSVINVIEKSVIECINEFERVSKIIRIL